MPVHSSMRRPSAGSDSTATPLLSYGLRRYIHSPLKRRVPVPVALLVPVVVCGALHDVVTTLVRGTPAILFTLWFFTLGVGVLPGRAAA